MKRKAISRAGCYFKSVYDFDATREMDALTTFDNLKTLLVTALVVK